MCYGVWSLRSVLLSIDARALDRKTRVIHVGIPICSVFAWQGTLEMLLRWILIQDVIAQ